MLAGVTDAAGEAGVAGRDLRSEIRRGEEKGVKGVVQRIKAEFYCPMRPLLEK